MEFSSHASQCTILFLPTYLHPGKQKASLQVPWEDGAGPMRGGCGPGRGVAWEESWGQVERLWDLDLAPGPEVLHLSPGFPGSSSFCDVWHYDDGWCFSCKAVLILDSSHQCLRIRCFQSSYKEALKSAAAAEVCDGSWLGFQHYNDYKLIYRERFSSSKELNEFSQNKDLPLSNEESPWWID